MQLHPESGLNFDRRAEQALEPEANLEGLEETLDLGGKPVLEGEDDVLGLDAFLGFLDEDVSADVLDQGLVVEYVQLDVDLLQVVFLLLDGVRLEGVDTGAQLVEQHTLRPNVALEGVGLLEYNFG